jgi:hypothetical protein
MKLIEYNQHTSHNVSFNAPSADDVWRLHKFCTLRFSGLATNHCYSTLLCVHYTKGKVIKRDSLKTAASSFD